LVVAATVLLCLPFLRTIYWLGDEGVILNGATRMLDGQRLYTDFFEFLPPGAFMVTAGWFKLVGISIVSTRALAILTVVGIACFTYLTCHLVSQKAPLSALITIGWVIMSQGPWTVISHHWFTTLFSMMAAWAALVSAEYERLPLRLPLIAGAAAGMAAMVTPTRGAYAAMAALLAYFRPRTRPAELIVYLVGCALAPMGLIGYLIWTDGLATAFDDVVMFPAEHYSAIQRVPFGALSTPQNSLLTYLFPAAALLLVLVCALDWRICRHNRRLRLCIAFAAAGFVGCFPRPDAVHIAFAAPLVLPLVLLCIGDLARHWRPFVLYSAVCLMAVAVVPSALWFVWTVEKALAGTLTPTPRGQVAAVDLPALPGLFRRIAATPSADAYFFYPYMPMMPFLTARNDVSPYDLFVPGYTLPSQYHETCIAAMRRAHWVVIDRKWTDPRTLTGLFPMMQNARPAETTKFEQALDTGFEPVGEYGSFELKHRRASEIDANVCNGIAQ
jgi:hypothetical protein